MGESLSKSEGQNEKLKEPVLKQAKPEDVKAVARSRQSLVGTPKDADSRVKDSEKADELLESMPLDVSEVTTVLTLKDVPDRRIVKLKDGKVGIYHSGRGSIYIESNRRLSGVLTEYDAETGEERAKVFGHQLSEKSRIAYEKLKEFNDKLNPKPPEKIDPEGAVMVDGVRHIPGRHIVKLKDGTLAIDHEMRQSYLLVYGDVIAEYDVSTGQKAGEISVADLSGNTKAAYVALQKLRGV